MSAVSTETRLFCKIADLCSLLLDVSHVRTLLMRKKWSALKMNSNLLGRAAAQQGQRNDRCRRATRAGSSSSTRSRIPEGASSSGSSSTNVRDSKAQRAND